MVYRPLTYLLVILSLAVAPLVAPAQRLEHTSEKPTREQIEARLRYRTGRVTLRSVLAPEGWGVIITFSEDGYVKDDDAAKIDYRKLLTTMQQATRDANPERAKAGYATVELVGWAEPPHYDSLAHKLYWAKDLKFTDDSAHTLNYSVRVLGRRGVLVLNAVSSMDQLEPVRRDMAKVIGFVEFSGGHRYADFIPGTDKVAEYGIAALIAGGLAAKAGLFKVL